MLDLLGVSGWCVFRPSCGPALNVLVQHIPGSLNLMGECETPRVSHAVYKEYVRPALWHKNKS